MLPGFVLVCVVPSMFTVRSPLNPVPSGVPSCAVLQKKKKTGLRGLGTFPPYKRGQINSVSVEGATLHMKVS